MNCTICDKHSRLEDLAGPQIALREGIQVSHFPQQDGVLATRGHLLVEPLRHIEDISELNEKEASVLGGLLARASQLIQEQLGAEHVYLFRINDKVAHLHFHLIPRYPGTPREFWGLQIMNYSDSPKVTLEESTEISQKLSAAF